MKAITFTKKREYLFPVLWQLRVAILHALEQYLP